MAELSPDDIGRPPERKPVTMQYIIDRLSETSTWRGFAMLATALGVAMSPDQIAAIIAAGTAIVGLIGVFLPDRR